MADQVFAVKSGFYDAVSGDRTYSAEDMNKPYSRVIADGVFATPSGTPSNDLRVMASGGGLKVTVLPGQAIIAGKWYENESSIEITIPSNTGLTARIDSVIAQIDTQVSGRVGRIVYRTGTTTHPAINETTGVKEYRIADITVAPSASTISQSAITDLRGADFPWVAGLIEQVDTSVLFAQYRSAYRQEYARQTAEYDEYTDEQRQAWEDFMSSLTQEIAATTNVLVLRNSQTVSIQGNTFPIGVSGYNPATDALTVYKNGLMCVPGIDYTADANSISFSDEVTVGQQIESVVYKSVISSNVDSVASMMMKLDGKVSDFEADTGWCILALNDGYTAQSGNAPAVRVVGGRAYLRGMVTGAFTAGSTICTVSGDFRPSADMTFVTHLVDGSALKGIVALRISASDGTLKVAAKSGTISGYASVCAEYLATAQPSGIIYSYLGTVLNYAALPASPSVGDIYTVTNADSDHGIGAGDSVMWNGSSWEVIQTSIPDVTITNIVAGLQ